MMKLIVMGLLFSLISPLHPVGASLEKIAPSFCQALSFNGDESSVFYGCLNELMRLKSGTRLIECIEGLFTKYCNMNPNPKPKINISFGDNTEFKPSDATGSPPREKTTKFAQTFLDDQSELLEEQCKLNEEHQQLMETNREQLNNEYENLFSSLQGEKFWCKKYIAKRCQCLVKHKDQIQDKSCRGILEEIACISQRLTEIDSKLKPQPDPLPDSPQPKQKLKDLNICLSINYRQPQLVPCAVAVEDKKVLISPFKTPFYIILSHELIHMKHYLEEQIFKESSLSATVTPVRQNYNKDPAIKSLFVQDSSESSVLKKLLESAEVRRSVFHKKIFAYSRLGSGDLMWSLGPKDRSALALMAYSIAGAGYIPTEVDTDIFPEGRDRDVKLFGKLVRDLEERRTVVGPDRDDLTENALRIEARLPIRYIYQDDDYMYESIDVVKDVFKDIDIFNYIMSGEWQSPDFDRKKADRCELSCKGK